MPGSANSLADNSAIVIDTIAQNFDLDTIAPTIAITDDDGDNSPSVGDTSTITFTLSEVVRNFEESDVTFSGGSLSNWKRVYQNHLQCQLHSQ